MEAQTLTMTGSVSGANTSLKIVFESTDVLRHPLVKDILKAYEGASERS